MATKIRNFLYLPGGQNIGYSSAASILPGEACVYRAPPSYDAWTQPTANAGNSTTMITQRITTSNGTSITHFNHATPDGSPKRALVYDNAPVSGAR